MQLKSKYVLPKIQMIINGLLSETQSSQIDFSHEEYSLQIKNRNLLIINWYEPQLTDLQWSLEFMGVKTLKHVSISHQERRKIRILFWKNNALHFFEAQNKDRQRISGLRKTLLQNQKVIQLPLPNNDDLLYISQDLPPLEKKGVFFIQTINKHFYVLMATDKKQELIDLNHQSKISKLLSSVTGFWTPMIDENQAQNTVISNILVGEFNDKESFKTITLRDFDLEIRFVNIPLNPGGKCKLETYQQHSVNLREEIYSMIKTESNLILTKSEFYKINDTEVVVVCLFKSLNQRGQFFMVSAVVDYKKMEHKEMKHLQFYGSDLLRVQFEKSQDIGELKYLIVKQQCKQGTILLKITLRDLEVLETNRISLQDVSFLCSGEDKSHLLLLCPFKVIQIDFKQREMIEQESKSMMEEESEKERLSSVKQIANSISNHKQKIQKEFKSGNLEFILSYFSTLGDQLNTRLTSRRMSSGNDQELRQLLKLWTSLSLYESIIKSENRILKKPSGQHRTFNDLHIKNTKQDYKQINSIFDHLIQQRPINEFLSIWIDFLESYKSKDYFKDENVRKVQSEILQHQFSHFINKILTIDLGQNRNDDLIFKFIRESSGIIKIQRQNYRKLLTSESNIENLKSIALSTVNFDLIQVICFETGKINKEQLQQCFKNIREQSQQLYESFVKQFVFEYLSRIKHNKVVNEEIKSFTKLLSIFPGQLELLRKILEESSTDLDILVGLRLGKRKEIAKKISGVAQRMRITENKEKLLLTIQNFKLNEIRE